MSGAAIHGLLAGTHVELVGVEDDPTRGGVRLFLTDRGKGIYAHVDDPVAVAEIREAWDGRSQHVVIPKPPPYCLFYESEEASHVG